MIPNVTRKGLALALAALAWTAAGRASAQVSPQEQALLERALANRAEGRLHLVGVRLPAEPIVIHRPRLDAGLLVGEIATRTLGDIEVYESRAIPLDQIRELRVRESRFVRGTLLGALAGIALASTLHTMCAHNDDCDGPYRHPAVYALSASTFAGLGGALASLIPGWRVIYSRPQPGLRIAQ